MAELFHTTPQTIAMRLRAVFEEGEVDEGATCKEYLPVPRKGVPARARTS